MRKKKKKKKRHNLSNQTFFNIISILVIKFDSVVNINHNDQTLYNENFR